MSGEAELVRCTRPCGRCRYLDDCLPLMLCLRTAVAVHYESHPAAPRPDVVVDCRLYSAKRHVRIRG